MLDAFAFTYVSFPVGGDGLGEQRLKAIFDHMFGAVREKLLAHLGPLVAVGENKLQDAQILLGGPLAA